jgi:hypothetical protein
MHFIVLLFFRGSVPPNIYKKAKQAPQEKREAMLIEELEQILAKEGLSSDPSALGSVSLRIDFFCVERNLYLPSLEFSSFFLNDS